VIVAVALLMNTASSPMNAAVFSFFVSPMRDDLGWSFAAMSWGFTLRLAVAGAGGPFLGALLDPSKNASWVWGVTIGGFLIYAALLLFSRPPRLRTPSGQRTSA
jgi:hypothetical protein